MNIKQILEDHKLWLESDRKEGSRANLSRATLRSAVLSNVNLSNANLINANLIGANLRGADLSGANLSNANLSNANLIGANLRDANLRYADLINADLRDADLKGANLRGADLSGADLSRAVLSGAVLWDCTGNRREIKSVFCSDQYPITYTETHLQIGCERYPISQWWDFDDKHILEMDGKTALKFWREWKDTLRMLIEKYPAKATLHELIDEQDDK